MILSAWVPTTFDLAPGACAAGVDPYDKAAVAPYEMVSFTSGFHGRTLGALALTYKDQYKTPFGPNLPGCHIVPYLDLEAAAQVIKKVSQNVPGSAALFGAQ